MQRRAAGGDDTEGDIAITNTGLVGEASIDQRFLNKTQNQVVAGLLEDEGTIAGFVQKIVSIDRKRRRVKTCNAAAGSCVCPREFLRVVKIVQTKKAIKRVQIKSEFVASRRLVGKTAGNVD